MALEIRLTAHAVERYQKRIRPDLTVEQARAELEQRKRCAVRTREKGAGADHVIYALTDPPARMVVRDQAGNGLVCLTVTKPEQAEAAEPDEVDEVIAASRRLEESKASHRPRPQARPAAPIEDGAPPLYRCSRCDRFAIDGFQRCGCGAQMLAVDPTPIETRSTPARVRALEDEIRARDMEIDRLKRERAESVSVARLLTRLNTWRMLGSSAHDECAEELAEDIALRNGPGEEDLEASA